MLVHAMLLDAAACQLQDIEAAGQQYLDDAPWRFDGTLPPVSDVSDAEV